MVKSIRKLKNGEKFRDFGQVREVVAESGSDGLYHGLMKICGKKTKSVLAVDINKRYNIYPYHQDEMVEVVR